MNIRGSVAYTERQLARDAAQQAEAKLLTGSRRLGGTITTDGCSADQIAELTKWDIDAWDKIQAARACTESRCATLVPAIEHDFHWSDWQLVVGGHMVWSFDYAD